MAWLVHFRAPDEDERPPNSGPQATPKNARTRPGGSPGHTGLPFSSSGNHRPSGAVVRPEFNSAQVEMKAGQARTVQDEGAHTADPQACAVWLEDHAAWMDGFLDEAESAAHEAHAAGCSSCARYARVLDRGLQLVRELPEIEPSAHFEQRLQHRIFHIEDDARLARGSGRSGAGLAAAAIIGLIAWSPMLWRADAGTTPRAFGDGDSYDAVASAPVQSGARMTQMHDWYVRPAAPAIEQTPVQHLVSYAGSYSPLIVSPPAYGKGPRALRLMSATTR